MNTVIRTLDTLFANRRIASTRNSARRRLAKWLCIEQLEDRRLLALVSWWTADNTGNDSAGMNHGTLMNGATYAVGQINQAFSFDGIDDRILVADSPSFELEGSLTIEGWIKVNSIPPNAHGEILFRGDSRPGLDPYSLAIEPNGQLNFLICSETSAVSIQSPAGLGQFVHVAATLDDLTGEMALYQNGVLVAQTTTSVRPFKYLDPTQNPAIGIGNANATYNARFDGLIDELRLYDVALTAEEVLSHFNAEKGSLQPTISINDTSVTEGETSETFLGAFVAANSGGLSSAKNIVFGHDGNGDGIQDLYVADGNAGEVIRYDGATGEFMDVFVSSGSGGLENPWAMAFGPDGNLYVGGRYIGVLRYSGTTGDFLDLYVSSEDYGIPKNINGILFGPDGNLYVSNSAGGGGAAGLHEVLRFQGPLKASPGAAMPAVGQTGAVFVANGSGGLSNPNGLAFGPDGNLYVANTWLDSVNRYDGASGAFLNTFVTPGSGGLDITSILSFGNDGYFYVTSQGTNAVLRYDGVSGAFVDAVIPSGSGGLAGAPGLAFDGDGNIYVASGSQVLRYGKTSDADFSIRLSAPFPMWVTVDYSTANGSATAGSDYISTAGTVTFAPGQTVKTIFVPIKDDFVSESTEIFYVDLANPVGGAIADGQGVGVIIDDEAPSTLFYDSFEVGEWNGLWVEDSQNDWFRSTQRAKDGSWSAEVDGSASNATLTTANAIDLSGVGQSTLTFDWLIESGFDSGEYLSLDISTNGGASWTQDVRRLSGNVSQEGVWHSETVDLTPYASSNMKVRFRAKVSASDEDANVDNVRIVAMPLGPQYGSRRECGWTLCCERR